MLEIHQIVSSYHGSNTYIIQLDAQNVILIDPGDPDTSVIEKWLEKNNKEIKAIFLTHEHADHCAGLNKLFKINPFSLFCSPDCEKNMRNSKQNFSFYIDIIDAFEVTVPAFWLNDGQEVTFEVQSNEKDGNPKESPENIAFTFYHTPGHSPGSACIVTGNKIFTGDTLLNGLKTPLTFPHSQKKEYHLSLKKLQSVLQPGMTVYPGHGDPFLFNNFETLLKQIKISALL